MKAVALPRKQGAGGRDVELRAVTTLAVKGPSTVAVTSTVCSTPKESTKEKGRTEGGADQRAQRGLVRVGHALNGSAKDTAAREDDEIAGGASAQGTPRVKTPNELEENGSVGSKAGCITPA